MDQTFDWHMVLLGLAGRLSDPVITRCRELLVTAQTAEIAPFLSAAVIHQRVALLDHEIDLLTDVMAGSDDGDSPLAQIEVTSEGIPMRYGFAANPPEDVTAPDSPAERAERAEPAAIEAASARSGIVGVWRAWRLPTEGSPSQQARRVFVVEADEDADYLAAMGSIQDALVAVGESDPQVEVYPSRAELPMYQRFARAYGELLWSRTPDPGVKIAVLYDDVDAETGPRFRPDHPTVDDEELPKLLEYLRRGEPLLLTTARLDDIVEPANGNAVPMSFRTDGTWVWSDAVTYYLEVHRLLPDPEMTEHARSCGHVPPRVDDVARHRAMAALQQPSTEEPAWTSGG